MSYLVMPEDLLPGGNSLEPSPPHRKGKSPRLEKSYPAISLPRQVTISPYIPVAPRDIPSSKTPMPSRKKGKKWLALPLADPDEAAVRDYNELPYCIEQPKEKREGERHAGVDPGVQEAVEPSTSKNDFNGRRVSTPVTIRNPTDMLEVELVKLVRPAMTKHQPTLKAKKVGEKKVAPVEKKQATRALGEPPNPPLLEGTVLDEEYFSTLPLAPERVGGFDEEREKVFGGTGAGVLNENRLNRGSSSWEARISSAATSLTVGKCENSIADKEPFSFDQKTMPSSNGYGLIRRPQAEPVDGEMLATYLKDHRGYPADPANPIPSIARRLAALEDAFRKLTASTNMDTKLREDFQNVTRDFQNKTLAEMTTLGANLQTLQSAVTSIVHRQDMVEDAMVNRMQRFEEDLLEDMGVSGRIVDQFRQLRNDTSDRFGELRKLREEVDTLLAESVQCRFRTGHILNNRVYGAKAPKPGATDKQG